MDNQIVIYLLGLALALCIIAYQIEVKNVKNTSERYKYLLRLPQELAAEILKPQYMYQQYMKSKAQLDRINVDKEMMNLVASGIPSADLVQKGINNRGKMVKFEKLLHIAPSYRIPERRFYSYVEKRLTAQLEQQARPVIPQFVVSFFYTSPKGRNHYRQDYKFSPEMILQYSKQIEDVEKYKQSARYQRSLMTDSLRYDVMKRDGFRCVLCGARAMDGVKLHVDHIRPVSKGGKTELPNLRTLCERCNLGKRDKFDFSGFN